MTTSASIYIQDLNAICSLGNGMTAIAAHLFTPSATDFGGMSEQYSAGKPIYLSGAPSMCALPADTPLRFACAVFKVFVTDFWPCVYDFNRLLIERESIYQWRALDTGGFVRCGFGRRLGCVVTTHGEWFYVAGGDFCRALIAVFRQSQRHSFGRGVCVVYFEQHAQRG
jgi:hypothetical protein